MTSVSRPSDSLSNSRSVDTIILEALDTSGFKLALKFPETFLVNFVDNIGVLYRDYEDLYPKFMPMLGAICESES